MLGQPLHGCKEVEMRIVLASKSPRRKELLGRIFDSFEIISKEVDESLSDSVSPERGVELLAIRKGAAVVGEVGDDVLVISSDTLVELDGIPLGKPSDAADAYRMLRALSGRQHNVHTGVAVHYRGRCASGVDTTRVFFKEMSDGDIDAYIATGEPMDKAGAYGIQGIGGRFVEKYEGNYDTVVGLSLSLLRELIESATEVRE